MHAAPHALALSTLLLTGGGFAQQKPNYDEARIPTYELPDPLRTADGEPVAKAADWPARRAGIFALFERQMYGRAPGRPQRQLYEIAEAADDAFPAGPLAGKVRRKQVTIRCGAGEKEVRLRLLLYLPAKAAKSPVFLGLNFHGNASTQNDPAIDAGRGWVRNEARAARGKADARWPLANLIARGYGLATMHCGDIDPDRKGRFDDGVHPLFYTDDQKKPAADGWGTIAAWAWGLSRALDYLIADPRVDGQRVAVVGHSRLGKTALWAGACDPRFALTISNNSGCGGAALSRRRIGETVARINKVFPHWFCDNFKAYGGREDALPFDQHMLIALIAPRPVLVVSADRDRWADPKGEFLAARHAAPVYRLLGTDGIATGTMPKPGRLIRSRIGYYLRAGKHDMTPEDWRAYMDFADHHGLRSAGKAP